MLTLPNGSQNYRIMGIDPGTDTLGVSIVDLDIITYEAKIIFVDTLSGLKGSRRFPEFEETFGSRSAKLYSNSLALSELVNLYRPNCIISESPYMGRFAQAFEALVECLTMIRNVILKYDPYLALETIDPSNVKKAVGASGRTAKGGDKHTVRDALFKLKGLYNHSNKPLELLDEHSIDATAVACFKLKQIYPNIFNQ